MNLRRDYLLHGVVIQGPMARAQSLWDGPDCPKEITVTCTGNAANIENAEIAVRSGTTSSFYNLPPGGDKLGWCGGIAYVTRGTRRVAVSV